MALVVGSGVASPAFAETAPPPESDILLQATSEGFAPVGADGEPTKVVSTEKEAGQSVSIVQAKDGTTALLLQLDWLSRSEGEPEDRSGQQGNEPTRYDEDGNLVATGGVTAEQTTLPEDVDVTPLIGVLSTDSEVQITLGDSYTSEAAIRRDGQLVGKTINGSFSENGLAPGSSYTYSVESLAETVDGSASSSVASPDAMSLTVAAHTTSENPAAKTLDASATPYALPTQQMNQWVHMTYIPQETVPIAWYEGIACDGAHAFKGDNRGDIYPGAFSLPSHRTAIRVAANWQNPDPWKIYWEKSTGITRKVVNGVVTETRQASPNGIEVLDTWVSGSVAHFDIRHDVQDPFCSVGSVKYRETVQFWQSGSVAVNGRHNNVPNHESYASFNTDTLGNQSFVKVWNFDDASYPCLVGWNSWCDTSYTASFTG
ncbi:hypothetical protein [Microbacterium aquimaris]|uniref:Fibronectin type-III domain-containing protein n=1 Tax=Microbacterium aquimaris TaxID=459816 RepID=A0ABU5N2G0_9MICO|nr:hypothetical protein [Microbacterium aquimaris]MDZ8160254.1 hypothetical protein [Microbacterium aquimaris]